MAFTHISTTSRPADNSTFGGNASNALLINANGAATGDLVVVIGQYRGSTTIEVNETGGQTWNTLTAFIDAANLCQVRVFWCRWSDEAANGNNPNFFANGISGNPFTCTGHIFRPSDSGKLIGVDTALTSTQFSAPSSPFTVTRNGITTTNASTVTIASWHTPDLNTWDSLSGTGWNVLGGAQYRNTTGSGQSSTLAYKIMTSAGATGDVSKNQATNGGDAGVSAIISFYEYNATSPISGSAAGSSTAAGAVTGRGVIAGSSTGAGSTSAALIGNGQLSGQSASIGVSIGAIIGYGYLSGTAAGTSTATLGADAGTGIIIIAAPSAISNSLQSTSTIHNSIITPSPIKNLI